jgi:hypothetical protein
MTRLFNLASVASALLLALPVAATAAPGPERVEHRAKGDVIWATPVAFTIDTGSAFKTFLIPPGAEFTDQLYPGEQVDVGWIYEPAGSSHAAVREATRTTRMKPAAPAPEEMVTGRVAFITPQDLALETDHGIELMALAPNSTLSDRLAQGEYVQVWYRVEPETGHWVVNRAAPGKAATAREVTMSATTPRTHSVTGEIEWVTPDRVVLATNHGLETFVIRHPSKIRDLGTGDDVRVTYRVVNATGTRTVARLMAASTVQPHAS